MKKRKWPSGQYFQLARGDELRSLMRVAKPGAVIRLKRMRYGLKRPLPIAPGVTITGEPVGTEGA